MAATKKLLKVTLKKSTNKKLEAHKACVRALGLRRIGHTVNVCDTPEIRGVIKKINYLLQVEEKK